MFRDLLSQPLVQPFLGRSPDPAYCYENKVTVAAGGLQKVKVDLKEILAELTFVVKGAPGGKVTTINLAIGRDVVSPGDVTVDPWDDSADPDGNDDGI